MLMLILSPAYAVSNTFLLMLSPSLALLLARAFRYFLTSVATDRYLLSIRGEIFPAFYAVDSA
jgi:hypothetical protein